MESYEIYKFLHVVSAIIWVGSGFGLFVLTLRMNAAGDRPGILSIGRHAVTLGKTLFMPASVSTLVWGVIMVLTTDGIDFTDTWIIVGLAGLVLSTIVGVGLIEPTGESLNEAVQEHGPDSAQVSERISRLLTLNVIDLVILFGVVWAMVMKPGA